MACYNGPTFGVGPTLMPTWPPGQGGSRKRLRLPPSGHRHRPHGDGILFSDSQVDVEPVRAYRETLYRVPDEPPFTPLVDQPCPGLASAHRRFRVECSACVTACNPLKQYAGNAHNAYLHARLGDALTRRGLAFLECSGRHPTNG